MAFIITPKIASKSKNVPVLKKPETRKLPYQIPDRYRDSFYLANASFFDNVNWFLHSAYEILFPSLRNQIQKRKNYNIDVASEKIEDIIKVLDNCNSVIDVRFPLKKDNGKFEIIRGFRGHYGLATGNYPCLGGLRLDENVTRDHIKALSTLSMWKNSFVGINLSGAHAGVKINPKNYSKYELQCILKQFAAELFQKGMCGGKSDIIHPDINTSEIEMKWISNTFAEFTGYKTNTASVGKGLDNDGLEGFEKAGALGSYYTLSFFLNQEKVLDTLGLSRGIKDKTFIIQGLGKIGAPLASYLVESGAVCVGVKEIDAYLYDSNGINLKELLAYREQHGTFQGYGLTKPGNKDDIYKENCDILIFSACHKSLICYMADKVKAKIVVEAADGPISPCSHKILYPYKVVIPDLYACSGTTIASYVEYIRNLQHLNSFTNETLKGADEVYGNVIKLMSEHFEGNMISASTAQTVVSSHNDVNLLSNILELVLTDLGKEIFAVLEEFNLGLDIRTAIYMIAIQKVFNKMFTINRYI